jgi:hypothetical protein
VGNSLQYNGLILPSNEFSEKHERKKGYMSIFFEIVAWVCSAFLAVAVLSLSWVAWMFTIAWHKGWLKENPNMTPAQISDRLFKR